MQKLTAQQRAYQRWFVLRPLREAAQEARRRSNERPRPPAAAQALRKAA